MIDYKCMRKYVIEINNCEYNGTWHALSKSPDFHLGCV